MLRKKLLAVNLVVYLTDAAGASVKLSGQDAEGMRN